MTFFVISVAGAKGPCKLVLRHSTYVYIHKWNPYKHPTPRKLGIEEVTNKHRIVADFLAGNFYEAPLVLFSMLYSFLVPTPKPATYVPALGST